MTSPFDIVLSPPPLEGPQLHQALLAAAPLARHPGRQQSVGFNLQHEFETLNADLDLDLNQLQSAADDVSSASSGSSGAAAPAERLPPAGAPAGAAAGAGYGFAASLLDLLPAPAALSAALALLLNNGLGFLAPLAPRPQSVQDFSFSPYHHHHAAAAPAAPPPPQQHPQPSLQFYADLLTFGHWIENLSSADAATMVDHLCNVLPANVLVMFKTKMEAHLGARGLQYDMERVLLEDYQLPASPSQPQLHQPKPKPNYRALVDKSRPKSADPHTRFGGARLPTSHLYEKTSFLQLAAGASGASAAPGGAAPGGDAPGVARAASPMGEDMFKLGALATINLRVALDLGRKNFRAYEGRYASPAPAAAPQEETRAYAAVLAPELPPAAMGLSMPADIANPELLSNIPAWLKLLRLHKYTECLKDTPWQELVALDDGALEEKGVRALGARRKLMKAFEAVRQSTK